MPIVTNLGKWRNRGSTTMKLSSGIDANKGVGTQGDIVLHTYADDGSNEFTTTLHYDTTSTLTFDNVAAITNLAGPQYNNDNVLFSYMQDFITPGPQLILPTSLTSWGVPGDGAVNTFNGSVDTKGIYTTNSENSSGLAIVNIPISSRSTEYVEFELLKMGAVNGGGVNTDELNFGVGIISKESYTKGIDSVNLNWVTDVLLLNSDNFAVFPQFQAGATGNVKVFVDGGATDENLTAFPGAASATTSGWLNQGLRVQIGTTLTKDLADNGIVEVVWLSNSTVVARHSVSSLTWGDNEYYFMTFISNTGTGGDGPVQLHIPSNTNKLGYFSGTTLPTATLLANKIK